MEPSKGSHSPSYINATRVENFTPHASLKSGGSKHIQEAIKKIWNEVKQFFTAKPIKTEMPKATLTTPQPEVTKKYANFSTPKLLPSTPVTKNQPQTAVHLKSPKPEPTLQEKRAQVLKAEQQKKMEIRKFANVDDFNVFIRDHRVKNTQYFQEVLSSNASFLNEKGSNGKTPLATAIENKNHVAVGYMLGELRNHIDINQELIEQKILDIAVRSQHLSMLKAINNSGVLPSKSSPVVRNASDIAFAKYQSASPDQKANAWAVYSELNPNAPYEQPKGYTARG